MQFTWHDVDNGQQVSALRVGSVQTAVAFVELMGSTWYVTSKLFNHQKTAPNKAAAKSVAERLMIDWFAAAMRDSQLEQELASAKALIASLEQSDPDKVEWHRAQLAS